MMMSNDDVQLVDDSSLPMTLLFPVPRRSRGWRGGGSGSGDSTVPTPSCTCVSPRTGPIPADLETPSSKVLTSRSGLVLFNPCIPHVCDSCNIQSCECDDDWINSQTFGSHWPLSLWTNTHCQRECIWWSIIFIFIFLLALSLCLSPVVPAGSPSRGGDVINGLCLWHTSWACLLLFILFLCLFLFLWPFQLYFIP